MELEWKEPSLLSSSSWPHDKTKFKPCEMFSSDRICRIIDEAFGYCEHPLSSNLPSRIDLFPTPKISIILQSELDVIYHMLAAEFLESILGSVSGEWADVLEVSVAHLNSTRGSCRYLISVQIAWPRLRRSTC